MAKNSTLKSGQLLKYIGKRLKNLNPAYPVMKFLGYDGNGFADIWVEYQGRPLLLSHTEVEEAASFA